MTNAWIDWFHIFVMLVNTKKYCHVGNVAKQCRLRLFQDSDFAGDLEDSKSTSGVNIVHVRKSNICSNKLDVQETNCCFSHFNKIWNYLFGHQTDIRWIAFSELWDLIVSVLGNVSLVSDGSRKPESDVYKHQKFSKNIDVMKNMDFVLSNVQSAR